MTFANSLDPDQARQNVGPDLDSNCLTLMVFLIDFFEKINFEKNPQLIKKHAKLPSMQRAKYLDTLVPFYNLDNSVLLPADMSKLDIWVADSVDPDQMPHCVAADLDLGCFLGKSVWILRVTSV